MRYGVIVWSMAMIMAVVRLLLPLDGKYMFVLRAYHLLPEFRRILNHQLTAGFSVKWVLCAVWITVTLLGVAFVLCSLVWDLFKRRKFPILPLSPSIRAAAQTCGLDPDIIRVSPAVSAPMTAGLLHPTVYLPAGDYPEATLPCILKHEATHIAKHDAWVKLGFLLFCCLFWWNPVVYFIPKSVDDILELRCDRVTLEGASAEEQQAYVEAMAYTARQACRSTPTLIGAGSFVQPRNANMLILRAKLALEESHPQKWRVRSMLALILAVFFFSYSFIVQPAEFPADNDGGVPIHIVTSQSSYLKLTPSGDYELWSNGEYAGFFPADALSDELFQDLEVLP